MQVPESVKAFVEKAQAEDGPSLEEPKDSEGRSPLHVAVKANFVSVVEYLIEAGADVRSEDDAGNTLVRQR